jgi:hypothetical protein
VSCGFECVTILKSFNSTSFQVQIIFNAVQSSRIPAIVFQVSNDSVQSPTKIVASDGNNSGKDPVEQELFEFLNNSAQSVDAVSLGRPSSTGSSRSGRTPESQSADSVQADDAAG